MAYLIDTQILIWSISNPSKLSTSTNNCLQKSEIFVSQISLFEIAIKQKIGKLLEIDLTLLQLINQIQSDGYQILWLKKSNASTYSCFVTNLTAPPTTEQLLKSKKRK